MVADSVFEGGLVPEKRTKSKQARIVLQVLLAKCGNGGVIEQDVEDSEFDHGS